MGVFILVLAGVLAAHIYGLRMFQANQTTLNATGWSRKTFGQMADEVRACSSVLVGNVTNGNFVGLLDGETQEGTGLMIYPTTNNSSFIVYFVNPADQTFRRATDLAGSAIILAGTVTNTMAFTAQDLLGNVLTNSLNNRVIHLALDFYQPGSFMQDPFNYKLETSVTRRALQ